MSTQWTRYLDKRLLVTESPLFGQFLVEVVLVEVSPSKSRIKFRHESGAEMWHDADEYRVEEVLAARASKGGTTQ